MREGECIADVIEGRADWIVVQADMRFALGGLPDGCADSCPCDPPYELGFMAKKWDRSGIAFDPEAWKRVLRVLKPGAHLAAFGGSRTYHRMACAIEDAGLEVRDSLMWLYGTGFPKSLNVSLAMDKAEGIADQRDVVHSYTASGNAGTSTKDKGGTYVTGAPNSDPVTLSVTRGASEKSRRWDGFGTALKPSFEPIVMARKPVDGTVIGNVEQHGTGALNIDACRVPTDWDEPDRPDSWKRSGHTADAEAEKIAAPPGDGIKCHPGGRWPPNVLLDSEMAGVLGKQSGDRKVGGTAGKEHTYNSDGFHGFGVASRVPPKDSGTAARFFPIVDHDPQIDAPFHYCAKSSTAEREAGLDALPVKSAGELTGGRKEGSAGLTPRAGAGRSSKGRRNGHPTIKPVSLLSWLCKIVTPPRGIVLDPFAGSGSCGIAATLNGFRYIGIEMDAEYVEIARARIRHWSRHGGPIALKPPPKDDRQTSLFGEAS